ncbi:MAG: aspartate 1-decarboxylase [Myxococcota bacterium]|nr:aspartate 1-decarboxylase [Myxococcota bacterium]
MVRSIFKSKIHRATVTDVNVDYEGSVTIDAALMRAADILPYEQVHVWNVTRGTRVVTYALPGPEGSGVLCINGAAAHGNARGDAAIVATFAEMTSEEIAAHRPKVVRVDASNRIVGGADEPETPGPQKPSERSRRWS